MKCALCSGDLIHKTGSIEFNSRTLGKVLVPGLNFLECDICNDRIINTEEADKAIEYISKKEQSAINKLPIGDFITAKQAADILGFSKQAFSKHPRVRRGLIYSVQLDNRRYYHKKSVEIFGKTGNGKFPLTNYKTISGKAESRNFIAPLEKQPNLTSIISNRISGKTCNRILVPFPNKDLNKKYFFFKAKHSTYKKERAANAR